MKKFKIEVEGNQLSDVIYAIEEAKRRIENGALMGFDSDDDGNFDFNSSGNFDDEND